MQVSRNVLNTLSRVIKLIHCHFTSFLWAWKEAIRSVVITASSKILIKIKKERVNAVPLYGIYRLNMMNV